MMAPKRKRAVDSESAQDENPYLKSFNELKKGWPNEMRSMFSKQIEDDEKRTENFHTMCNQGYLMQQRFGWAIPDERSLRAIAQFGPIVEIGCGLGYWSSLLKKRGVDVNAYDILPEKLKKARQGKNEQKSSQNEEEEKDEDEEPPEFWTEVLSGGPEVLLLPENKGRTLFLCYPDDYEDSDESMALQCLTTFTGDYVVHVGELSVGGTGAGTLSCRQAPWGRTTDPGFQERLAATFHPLLQLSIPRWPHTRDTLTVWKRTQSCLIDIGGEDDSNDEEEVGGSEETRGRGNNNSKKKARNFEDKDEGGEHEEQEEDIWAVIPEEEILQIDAAAPSYAHLLSL